ncbi:unnamed protein product [Adineta ricciae]|uniref:Uncharacterized protein n=2 Tax=Adineta ricciae TaxID=249248 RepID=A0A815L8B6_ADIRI|nr:unnamed protein product [Adineta ricciae]
MPSFKERFRSSRKYKKNKDAAASGTDENATGSDDHSGSGASSSHYSVDYHSSLLSVMQALRDRISSKLSDKSKKDKDGSSLKSSTSVDGKSSTMSEAHHHPSSSSSSTSPQAAAAYAQSAEREMCAAAATTIIPSDGSSLKAFLAKAKDEFASKYDKPSQVRYFHRITSILSTTF